MASTAEWKGLREACGMARGAAGMEDDALAAGASTRLILSST